MSMSTYCKVQIGFGSDPFSSISYTNVSTDVRRVNCSTSRRSSEFEAFGAGRCQVVLDNRDGTYDPNNSSGTHYGDFKQFTPIRVDGNTGGWTQVFFGFVRQFKVEYPGTTDSVCVVEAYDPLWLLAEHVLAPITESYGGELAHIRIGRVLEDEVGWPNADRDLLAPPNTTLQATTYNRSALAEILTAVNADGGVFYYEPNQGEMRFDPRDAIARRSRMSTSQETFDDSTEPTFLANSLVMRAFGDNYRNLVEITPTGLTTQTVDNRGANEAGRSYTRALTMESEVDALGLANYYADLWGTEVPYVAEFSVLVYSTQAEHRDEAIGVRLRDRITVTFDPPGAGTTFNRDMIVDGITHSVTPSRWVTSFRCTSADAYDDNLLGPPADWMIWGTDVWGTGEWSY